MPSSNSFTGRSFTWTLAGNVVYSLCQWAFLIVLAKLGTPEDVGGYALGIAIISPILMFANFQARSLVASDIDDSYSFGEYLGFRVVSLALAILTVLVVAAYTRHSVTAAAVTCLLAISQSFDITSDTYFGLIQKYDRLDRIGQSMILKGPLCLLLLSAAMYFTRSLLWAAAALAVGRGLMLWLFDSRVAFRLAGPARMVWHRKVLLKLLKSALPLGVILALNSFAFSIPRYFIEADLNTRELGIFSAVASLVGAGNLVMSALASCSFVDIAKAFSSRDRKRFYSLSLRLFGTGAALGAAGVVVALVAGDKILVLLFRPEYGGSASVFTRLMLAGALGYVLSGQGAALTAARILRPQIPIFAFSAAATALFCWWLVPLRGLNGAAEAWLLASVIEIGLFSILISRVRRDDRQPAPEAAMAQAASAEIH